MAACFGLEPPSPHPAWPRSDQALREDADGREAAERLRSPNDGSHLLSPKSREQVSRNLRIASAAMDSTGFCRFVVLAILEQGRTFEAMVDTINAMHGLRLTPDDLVELGRNILETEHNFNQRVRSPAPDVRPR
ncbi:aldehyde ferredoxin oxidoreductase C-terminal domain-containing protein, partial [Desulfohalovibrio reitneri]|uniref:aldehyde ferredoxin oxidoreductase C-terminal domain-containing protein n=1 Tax=Desulfohalovibrio reitneri TaxID=1307759 RepID=UPI003CC6235F